MNAELLHRVCVPDGRPLCEQPSTVRINGDPWTAATDGKRLLLLGGGEGEDGPFAPLIHKVLQSASPCTWRTDMASLRAWAGQDGPRCPHCRGTGRDGDGPAQDCERCDGEGTLECDLGHEHDCPKCDGLGVTARDCSACKGTGAGRASLSPGTFAQRPDIVLDRRYLGDIIHDLPGECVDVALTAPDKGVEFRAHGWRLLVMPLQGRGNGEYAALDLTPIEAPPDAEHQPRDESP